MNRLQNVAPRFISLLGAGLYAFWMAVLALAGGPNWVMVPSDINYIYLLNGLNILSGHPLGALVHPAISVSYFCALSAWFIHALVGSGELVRDVLEHPEFYMRAIVTVVATLNTASIFALGQMIYAGTQRRSLILVGQCAFILCPTTYLYYISFGGPESFQTIFLVLLVAVTVATMERGLPDPGSRLRYVATSALLVGAAMSTKFTSIPMMILPFLVVPTFRWKAAFVALTGVSAVLFLSPIFLVPGNWAQFMSDMHSMAVTAAKERAAAGAGALWSDLLVQARNLYGAIPLFIQIVGIEAICGVLLLVLAIRRRSVITHAGRIYGAVVLTLVGMLCFALIRPKPVYIGLYTPVLGLGLVLLIYFLGRQLVAPGKLEWIRRQAGVMGAVSVLVFLAALGRLELTSAKVGVPALVQLRDDALTLNRMVFPIPESEALVTAIQASNIYTALDHANQNSNYVHAKVLAEIFPPNRYNYLFDGKTVEDRNQVKYTLHYLKNKYKKVYVWTLIGNLQGIPGYIPPAAIMRTLFDGQTERLVEIEAAAIPGLYDATRSAGENRASGWINAPCGADCRSLQASVDDEVVTHYKFRAINDENAKLMPTQWRVDASGNGTNWKTLGSEHHEVPWSKGESKIYPLDNTQAYRYYRFIETSVRANAPPFWLGEVTLYTAGSGVKTQPAVATVALGH
jgi:hypothetical protein